MIGEILATGDELRSGSLIDSNSAYISQKLEESGLEVTRHSCVGDDLVNLKNIIKEIGGRADIAIITGGLGPTTDDLSAEAAALAAGDKLVIFKDALKTIESFFLKAGRKMPASNKKQALLPKSAEVILNPVGTAPGFILKLGKCVFFFLPGVPFEMKKMLCDQVLVRIHKLLGNDRQYCLDKTISTFGLPESTVGEKVALVEKKFPGIKLGLRANFPEIQVKLYAKGASENGLTDLLNPAAKWVKEQLGKHIFSMDGYSLEVVIGQLLREQKASLGIAESCTGGLIANRITNVAGSSDYFIFSGVTYSNDAKIKVLGVLPATIEKFGAVAKETVKEMAKGVKDICNATYGLATTGIAGPSGGSLEKPVGTIWVGLAGPQKIITRQFNFSFGRRLMNKKIFASAALDLFRRELQGVLD